MMLTVIAFQWRQLQYRNRQRRTKIAIINRIQHRPHAPTLPTEVFHSSPIAIVIIVSTK